MRDKFLYLLLFCFLSLILFWPVFLGKVNLNGNFLVSFYAPYSENLPYKNTGWDQLRIYFPFLKITQEAYKNWSFPLWNPFAFSGHPHMADFQTAVFYPFSIFAFVLPQIEFWHVLRITPMILGAFFTFIYLKNLKIGNFSLRHSELDSESIRGQIPKRVRDDKRGEMSTLASVFGAITFGFSPFILTWGEEVVMSPHSVVWLPLILWAIDRFLGSKTHPRGVLLESVRLHPGGVSKRIYLVTIALASAASLLGGYMQTSIYMFIFVIGYLFFRLWQLKDLQTWSFKLFQTGFGIALGVGIAAIQLLPSAELYFNSARSEVTLRNTLFDFLLPIESLLTYFAADFFGHPSTHNFFRVGVAQYYEGIMFVGVTALMFAVYAVVFLSHPRGVLKALAGPHPGGDANLIRFLTIFGLVALSTTLDLPTSKLFLSLPIPFLSTSIANRVLFVPAFCLAILAALGFQVWLVEKDKKILRVIFTLGGIYLIVLASLFVIRFLKLPYFEYAKMMSSQNVVVSLRNLAPPIFIFLISSFLIFVSTLRPTFKKTASIFIIALAFLHIFLFSQKYFSFNERKFVFSRNEILDFIVKNQGIDRSWGLGGAFFENNFASQYGIFWPEGYDSLNNRSYAEFTYGMQGLGVENLVFRADAGLGRDQSWILLENENRRKLIDMVGVKYVIAKDIDSNLLTDNNFRRVFESEGEYSVWENPQVLPRVFLASSYEGPPTLDDVTNLTTEEIDRRRRKVIFNKLLADDFDFRNSLILEKPSPISPQFGEGTVEVVSYKPQEVIIKTSSDEPKLLYMSDNYYPGWKAKVDGEETAILRANYTFRSVPLIAGEHEVRFYYEPDSFKAGLVISVVSLVGIAFLLRFRLSSIVDRL